MNTWYTAKGHGLTMDTYSEIEAMHAECMAALNRMAWACADVQIALAAVGVEALDSFFKNDSLREGHAAEIDKISIFENLTE